MREGMIIFNLASGLMWFFLGLFKIQVLNPTWENQFWIFGFLLCAINFYFWLMSLTIEECECEEDDDELPVESKRDY